MNLDESPQEFLERMKQGLYEEMELVFYIYHYLLNPAQTAWMVQEGLNLQDILNGRFNGEQAPTVEAIFLDWNLKCRMYYGSGADLFKL